MKELGLKRSFFSSDNIINRDTGQIEIIDFGLHLDSMIPQILDLHDYSFSEEYFNLNIQSGKHTFKQVLKNKKFPLSSFTL